MKLAYRSNLVTIGRSGETTWIHFISVLSIIVLVAWGLFAQNRVIVGFSSIIAGWVALDLYQRKASERVFLVDPNAASFIVRVFEFGRIEDERIYSLSELDSFLVEGKDNCETRIVALMKNGDRIPLQASYADYYYGLQVSRMNASVAKIRNTEVGPAPGE